MKTTHLTDPKSVTRISVRPPSTHLAPHPETPSLRNEGEGVTGLECPCCNGDQYLQIDEHEVERCPFC